MIYWLLAGAAILLTSVAHILLKRGTTGDHIYFNRWSMASYGIFATVTALSVLAMQGIEMKTFYAFNSLTFICIPAMSYVVLKEKFTIPKTAGAIVICAGLFLFNL